MHSAASNEAPPYFERASYELNTGTEKKAGAKLDTDLEFSAAAAYAFGGRDADSIFSEEATDTDYKYLGMKAPKEAQEAEPERPVLAPCHPEKRKIRPSIDPKLRSALWCSEVS
jgi:hypothetical protein